MWMAVTTILVMLVVAFSLGLQVATTLGLTALIAGLIFIGPVWEFLVKMHPSPKVCNMPTSDVSRHFYTGSRC